MVSAYVYLCCILNPPDHGTIILGGKQNILGRWLCTTGDVRMTAKATVMAANNERP